MAEDNLVHSHDANHPANLICELCKLFYSNGWVTGTGGGISVKDGYVCCRGMDYYDTANTVL